MAQDGSGVTTGRALTIAEVQYQDRMAGEHICRFSLCTRGQDGA